ncbi:ATP-binding protein, partial [Sphingorhabdus sp.]|uniref:PAS domain-containing sensor histidine kinase n=1 Tax=Sphingorhabdus sp. TaxID=1902408 RepID=UPI00391D1B2C
TDSKTLSQGNMPMAPGRLVRGALSSPVPMLLIDGSADNVVLTANSSFLRMSGLKSAQISGSTLATALAGIMDQKSIQYVTEQLALAEPATWEIETRRPDQSVQRVGVINFPISVAEPNRHQHLLTFLTAHGDLHAWHPTADEIRALYMHTPGFIAMTEGPEHRLTFANESYKQYVGRRQLEGLTVVEAMPETVEQGFIELLDNVFETGIPYHGRAIPYEFPDPESGEITRRYGDFVYVPVRDANSNIVGLFCEGHDITKQKEAEAAVETLKTKVAHASRVNAMGTMATTMAHELNQPLTAILNFTAGALRLLDRPDADRDAIRQAISSIQESSERAAAIIRTLRDLTDRRVRAHAEFQLRPVVAEALNLVRNSCSVDTNLQADIAGDVTLNADRVQIQQVIINLVRNGCDAVAGLKVQDIKVVAVATDEDVTIAVRDTGPGLAVESAQDIFTWMNSSKESGMGLGLSICRTIVESHGGRIWLEDSSDRGTEFRFSLPRTPSELT